MGSFDVEVLTTKDLQKWSSLLSNAPQKDIYFMPEYALVFEKTFGDEAQLFFYGNRTDYVLYPYFKRKINALPFYNADTVLYDMVSPWYYGGPLISAASRETEDKLMAGFFTELHEYCRQNNIITEFTRLHPFIKNHALVEKLMTIEKRWEVVYVDLTQDEETIWNNFKKENRKAIRKANNSGVKVVLSQSVADREIFYTLYTAAMERKQAGEFYFFPREFFHNMFQLLGNKVQLFLARYDEQTIAASLLVGMDDFAHDYLRASVPEFLNMRPNNLLVYTKILWAREHNYKFFSLQGGRGKDDDLFRFKSTFSSTTADFYTYSKVHNEEMYRMLCEARDKYDRLQGIEVQDSDYFPKYRR